MVSHGPSTVQGFPSSQLLGVNTQDPVAGSQCSPVLQALSSLQSFGIPPSQMRCPFEHAVRQPNGH